jgi:hypothetical protein
MPIPSELATMLDLVFGLRARSSRAPVALTGFALPSRPDSETRRRAHDWPVSSGTAGWDCCAGNEHVQTP